MCLLPKKVKKTFFPSRKADILYHSFDDKMPSTCDETGSVIHYIMLRPTENASAWQDGRARFWN